jgi:hypothetical protein
VRALAILFVLLLLMTGCIGGDEEHGDEDSHGVEAEEEIPTGVEIQTRFEEAYSSLSGHLLRGDPKGALEDYEVMVEMYHETNDLVGTDHLRFFFTEEELEQLGHDLEQGDLPAARGSLQTIGGSCGVDSCHNRMGSSMARLEVEYGIIKKALGRDDLKTAQDHLAPFSRYWDESRRSLETFMPEQVEILMKDEYLHDLNKSISEKDIDGSLEAIGVISDNTCSLSGCHTIFFSNQSEWKFF